MGGPLGRALQFPSEEDLRRIQKDSIYTPETPEPTYGLGLCGDDVIRPEAQRQLDEDIEKIIQQRLSAASRISEIVLE
ncbi:MAG TPA: hypothetical protein VMR18_00620 [Candidatus Saccharimonadales bacterium]|nr:hypothetical protein [Candidatus Saccharimonadales bacterium]